MPLPVPENVTEDVAHLFSEQPEFAKPTFTLLDLVTQVAKHFEADPIEWVATCWVLSKFNPIARERWQMADGRLVEKGTRGSLPTKFGLFLLSGGPFTQAELEDPATNARLAFRFGAFLSVEETQEHAAVVAELRAGRAPEGFLEAAGVAFLGEQPFP